MLRKTSDNFVVFMHLNNVFISAINRAFIREKRDTRLGNVSGVINGLTLAFPVLHI